VRGYSISEEEFEEGLSAVAAPIRDFAGRTVAVLSISGPAFRLSAGKVIAFGALVREGAEMISRQLGFLPAEPSQSDTALAAAT
jgi:DNA-binding IclR family transcriptional regulator